MNHSPKIHKTNKNAWVRTQTCAHALHEIVLWVDLFRMGQLRAPTVCPMNNETRLRRFALHAV